MASAAFCFLWMSGKLHTFSRRGYERAIWKYCVCLALLMVGVFVCVSRVYDKKHHWWNVLFGAILGAGSAATSYHLYFGLDTLFTPRAGPPLALEDMGADWGQTARWYNGWLIHVLQCNGDTRAAAAAAGADPCVGKLELADPEDGLRAASSVKIRRSSSVGSVSAPSA